MPAAFTRVLLRSLRLSRSSRSSRILFSSFFRSSCIGFAVLLTLFLTWPPAIAALATSQATTGQCGVNMSCPPAAPIKTAPIQPVGPGASSCGPEAGGRPCSATGVASQASQGGANLGAGNPINVISGNKYQQEVDLPALPGILGLEIIRHYNSAYSTPNATTGIMGRGWKLSYETSLTVIGNTLQIMQADGSRIIFNRDPNHPSSCSSIDPSDGTLTITNSSQGETFVWTWTTGRTLQFDSAGKLVQIAVPTGEFVSLQHDRRGMLVQVTDPQGRQLNLQYPKLHNTAGANHQFGGVASITSPVGTFSYAYGSTPNQTGTSANLVQVVYPNTPTNQAPSQTRHYHYEDRLHPTLLTGISNRITINGQVTSHRVSTYGYNRDGKATLSVRGEPARLQLGSNGKPLQPARLVDGTGIGQVTLDYATPGITVMANSLGQQTTYRHAIIGGHYRLLEVRGAGCTQCGEMNVRYGYDAFGRQTSRTHLTRDGQPHQATLTQYDANGRPIQVSLVHYTLGKAAPAQWQTRYQYGTGQASFPTVITRPSVVAGRNVSTRITYGASPTTRTLPIQIDESGYSPAANYNNDNDDNNNDSVVSLHRTVRYRYNDQGQQIAVDQALPNAMNQPGPANSDITLTQYDPVTKLMTKQIAPGNVVTEITERDTALRLSKVKISDGYTAQTIHFQRNWRGQPEEVTIQATTLTTQAAANPNDSTTSLKRTLRYQYDATGNLIRVTQPDGLTTHFMYDDAGRLQSKILADGNRITIHQDTEGQILTESLYAADDPALHQALKLAHFRYDDANHLTQIDDTQGIRTQIDYNDLDQVTTERNALNTQSLYTYDPSGMLTSRTAAANSKEAATERFGYDNEHHATRLTDANNVTTQRLYDDFGRKTMETNPDRGVTLYRYDLADRLIAKIDQTLVTTRYTYDYANRLIASGIDKQPNQTQYRYQGRQLVEIVSKAGPELDQITERTQYKFDAMHQLKEERRWIAKVSDLNNNHDHHPSNNPNDGSSPTTPTIPNGIEFITKNTYDDSGRLIKQTLADGHQLTWQYATADAHTNPGQLETILFDDQIIVSGIHTTASGDTHYTNGNGTLQTITRDARDRILQVTTTRSNRLPDPSAVASWWQQRTTSATPSSAQPDQIIVSQSNRYDAADRLIALERLQSGITPQSSPTLATQQFAYDQLDRLTRIQIHTPTEGLKTTTFAYDPGGNRLIKTIAIAATDKTINSVTEDRYQYATGRNRLLAVTQLDQSTKPTTDNNVSPTATLPNQQALPLQQTVWSYNDSGVPMAKLSQPINQTAATNPTHSQPTQSERIVYNDAQRPIAIYDVNNRLIARYEYNNQGERIAKSVYINSEDVHSIAKKTIDNVSQETKRVTQYSLYQNQRLSAETDSEGHITTHYVYLNGLPVAKIEMTQQASAIDQVRHLLSSINLPWHDHDQVGITSDAHIYAIHTDHLGTPQAVTDAQQTIVWQAQTDPFGQADIRYAKRNPITKQRFEMKLRLPGQLYDAETGLHYNYLRDYDPALGRYVTPDPIGLAGGMNPYEYVSNNPLSRIDRLGLYEEDVHYYMTYFLGLAAGLPELRARMIAMSNRYIDDNPFTEPYGKGGSNFHARELYHFTQIGYDPLPNAGEFSATVINPNDIEIAYSPEYIQRRVINPINPQLTRLHGYAMDASTTCQKLQFYGEYLHAFEDTFAHRDAVNIPYTPTFGHVSGGHNPDHTYNAGGWDYNEARTFEMEKEVFAKLALDFAVTAKNQATKKTISFDDLKATLVRFNQDETLETPKLYLSSKIKMLNKSLTDLGLPAMQKYDAELAPSCRIKNLKNKDGSNLEQKAFPGAILQTYIKNRGSQKTCE
jgi:RHS repeat-associated protein